MPFINGGGGGGGPAAGTYLPVAHSSGVTVDTTTYNDTIKGSGKLTTLVFPAEQGSLAIAFTGDAFPRWMMSSDASDYGLLLGDGTFDLAGDPTGINCQGGKLNFNSTANRGVSMPPAKAANDAAGLAQLSPRFTVTSGALPTVQLVTATGAQILTSRDAETVTPCTFNPGAATTATVTAALSPDNVTYSTLAVVTEPAGVALDGTILPVKVRVPAGWYLKLTANAQAVLGLTTYY